MATSTRRYSLEQAVRLIASGSESWHDFCANIGQIPENIKHLKAIWALFRDWLNQEGGFAPQKGDQKVMSGSGQEKTKVPSPKLKNHIVVKEMGFTFCGLPMPIQTVSANAPDCQNCKRSYQASLKKTWVSARLNLPLDNLEDCIKILKMLNWHRLDKKALTDCIDYLNRLQVALANPIPPIEELAVDEIKLSTRQRNFVRHAVGFDGRSKTTYRNHFCVSKGGDGYEDWMDLVNRGLANHRKGDGEGIYVDDTFWATRKLALAVRNVGERVSSEFRE